MKNLLIILGLMLSPAAFAQQTWEIKDNYEVNFSGTKAEGSFRGLEGKLIFDPNKLESAVFDVSVDVGTISTGNKTKDKHARGDSWFDADKFPKIYFKSEEFSKKSDQGYEVTGELNLKGIKKKVTIDFRFEANGDEALFTGNMVVNREEFGIEGNFFAFLVGDDFKVDLKVPVQAK